MRTLESILGAMYPEQTFIVSGGERQSLNREGVTAIVPRDVKGAGGEDPHSVSGGDPGTVANGSDHHGIQKAA